MILSIDPGRNGAVVLIQSDCLKIHKAIEMPKTPKEFAEFIDQNFAIIDNEVYLEKITAHAVQSKLAAFSFGGHYALLQYILQLRGFNIVFVNPVEWKKFFNLHGKTKKNAIEETIKAATKINGDSVWFTRKNKRGGDDILLDGIADAFMMRR